MQVTTRTPDTHESVPALLCGTRLAVKNMRDESLGLGTLLGSFPRNFVDGASNESLILLDIFRLVWGDACAHKIAKAPAVGSFCFATTKPVRVYAQNGVPGTIVYETYWCKTGVFHFTGLDVRTHKGTDIVVARFLESNDPYKARFIFAHDVGFPTLA